MTTGEEAVRSYLTYLADPGSLVNASEIKKLESAAAKVTDVLERLRALSALHNAKHVDATRLRADFVRLAKAWAAEQGLATPAFVEMGVPADVLEDAGLSGSGRRRGSGSGSGTRTAGPARSRAPRVGADEIRTAILARAVPFTVNDVQSSVGGSPGTIKKVLDELQASGEIERRGAVADWAGRGRAPYQYARKAGR